MARGRRLPRFDLAYFGLFLLYPPICSLIYAVNGWDGGLIGGQLTDIFIYSVLALGLNVVVGYTGLLHLGIAAFFGIGAYTTGVLTASQYPFQWAFPVALLISILGAALVGVVLGAPTLRLRGDYLALVTLGFGEVTRFAIRNLEEITGGTTSITGIPPPFVASWPWGADYRLFYYLALGVLILVVLMLRNLERSRLGRAWMAIREDELAATCMGIEAGKVKLSAFALGAGLAGLAGSLFATKLTSTAGPDAFDFNRSIITLCCVILGGLGSLRGALLGVLLLVGFDSVLSRNLDAWIQQLGDTSQTPRLLQFSSWRLMVFGLALILMMRFRPEGLLPSSRVKAELRS